MYGCVDGQWVLGRPHSNTNLPPTVAYGVYNDDFTNASLSETTMVSLLGLTHLCSHLVRITTNPALASVCPPQVNITASTAAECQSIVRNFFPTANAAYYSNIGQVWCKAVFGA